MPTLVCLSSRPTSLLAPRIRRLKELCDAKGDGACRSGALADVRVSKSEWAKYGSPPVDLAPARIFVDDVLDAAADVGALPVDLTGALVAAEPSKKHISFSDLVTRYCREMHG